MSAKKEPGCAMLLSAIAPGAGQFYNGDNVKGAICLTATAVSVGMWCWTETRYGFWAHDRWHAGEVYQPLRYWGIGFFAVNWGLSVVDAGLTCWMRNVKTDYGMNLDMDKKKVKAELTYKF